MGHQRQQNDSEGEEDDFGFDFMQNTKSSPQIINPQPSVITNIPAITPGEIKMSVKEYMQMKDQIKHLVDKKPPRNYIISEIKLVGDTKGKVDQCARLTADFSLQQLYDDWSCVELLPTSIVILNSTVVLSEHDSETATAYLGVSGSSHSLFVKHKGAYNVHLEVKVPFSSSRGQGMDIKLPKAVKNTLQFTVHQRDIEITAVPSLGPVLSPEPGSKEYNATDTGESSTILNCDVPPTNHLSIQWKEKLEDEVTTAVNEQEKEVIINAEQFTVHSIGEGIVQTSSELHYRILHGSRSSFEILVPSHCRILSIEGEAIKRWDVVIDEKKGEAPEGGEIELEDNSWENQRDDCKLLKVWLDYGIENSYQLTLHCETDMESTSCAVIVPTISCNNIHREKGFLAIEARTNVEVSELQSTSLARISFNELPSEMVSKSVNPPLLSYKFLLSHCTLLELDVKKHDDAEVLVASIESAHLQATLSEDKILYNFTMQVRNTQTQYVRIRLPENSTVWSSLVSNNAVKPAKDDGGYVMIPLQKSRATENKHEAFSVELVYLTVIPNKFIGNSGRHTLNVCPLVDIPINHLFVTVKLPIDCKYSEFTGGLQEVNNFSSQPPSSEMTREYVPMQQQVQMQTNSFSPMKKKASHGRMASGVLPVKVHMPSGGKSFFFERLLVIDESFEISVNYKKIAVKARRLGPSVGDIMFRIALVIVILAVLMIYFYY